MNDTWLAVLELPISGVFFWELVRGFRTGTMELPQLNFTMSGRRADQPVRFWLLATFLAALALSCFCASVWMLTH